MSAFSLPRLHLTIGWPVLVPLLVAALFAAAVAGTGAQGGSAAQGAPSGYYLPAGQVSDDLAGVAARAPQRSVEVIVQLRAGAAPIAVSDQIALGGGQVFRALPLINGLGARMKAADAAALAQTPGVKAVSLNAGVVSQGALDPAKLKTAYIQSIRAEKAWAGGYTGKGVGIAIVDSGLDGSHADFRRSETDGRSRGVVSAVVNPRTGDARDGYGHGTHVAGLAAGNGFSRPAGDAVYGRYAGVAPEANIIAVKADDGAGQTDVISLIDGLQFVVSQKDKHNIRVVNLSVRSASANSYKTDPLAAAVEAVWMHGIVVVAAAGNTADAADAVHYAPGNDPYVITVGSVDDKGTKSIDDDVVASWSGRGKTQDGFAKPDVLAPGAHMVAPLGRNSHYASACPSCVVDGEYIRIGGTSMSAAVVSGAVAAIAQAKPTWTPDQIKATLIKRSRSVTDGTGTIVGNEVALDKVLFTNNGSPEPAANQGLTPNDRIDPATGTIKDAVYWDAAGWGAAGWGAAGWGSADAWTAAAPQWSAEWAQASFTGTSLDPNAFDPGNPADCWRLAAAGWGAAGWGAAGWGAAGWGSDQVEAAGEACNAAAEAQAAGWGAAGWGAAGWGAAGWGAAGWGAAGWGAAGWGAAGWGAAGWGAAGWGAVSDFSK